MEERPEQRYHRPVLLEQTIEALDIRPDGVYLDGTAGGGGHSFAIASRITTGRLIALDRDPDAVKEAGQRLQGLPAAVVQAYFSSPYRNRMSASSLSVRLFTRSAAVTPLWLIRMSSGASMW